MDSVESGEVEEMTEVGTGNISTRKLSKGDQELPYATTVRRSVPSERKENQCGRREMLQT
jgi:hypothetical protein